VKIDSPDPAEFRHIICRLWKFAQWLGRPFAYCAVTSTMCQRSAQGALPDMPHPAYFVGFFFCAGRDMPTAAQTIARSARNRQWIRCRVIAKSAESEDPVLTSMGAHSMDRSFKTADF
jgi:hypothetical protein